MIFQPRLFLLFSAGTTVLTTAVLQERKPANHHGSIRRAASANNRTLGWTGRASSSDASSGCIQDLDSANSDRDSVLDESEYLQFVQTRIYDDKVRYPDCHAPGEAQTSTFKALALSSCQLDGNVDECGDFVNITGADQPDDLDILQRTSLLGICIAAETVAALECASTSQSRAHENDLCAENINSADIDQNSFLDETEYAAFVAEHYNNPQCVFNNNDGDLPPAQLAAFDTLAGASCLSDPNSVCCVDAARISISGAAQDASFWESIRLKAICAAAQTASDMQCLTPSSDTPSSSSSDDNGTPSPTPSPSPSSDDTGTPSDSPSRTPTAVPTAAPTATFAPTGSHAPTMITMTPAPTGSSTSEEIKSSSWPRTTNQVRTVGVALVVAVSMLTLI